MCFFVGYKYAGGGYRVWVPNRRVVVESRDLDLDFFDDGLPPPTLIDSIRVRTPPTRTSRPHNLHLTTPLKQRRCQLRQIFTASLEATHDNGPMTTPHPHIIIRLPERLMKRNAETNPMGTRSHTPNSRRSYVPDYPARSTRSGLMRNGGGGDGSAMLILQSRFQPDYLAVSSSRSCFAPRNLYARRWRPPMLTNGRRP